MAAYPIDPFNPATPSGPQAIGYADDELRAIKQVLVDWKVQNETGFQASIDGLTTRVTALESGTLTPPNLRDALIASKVYQDTSGASNVVQLTIPEVAADAPFPTKVRCVIANHNTNTTVTLVINGRPACRVVLETTPLVPIHSLDVAMDAEFWLQNDGASYVLHNPILAPAIPTTTEQFEYTGGTVTWTVPADVYEITAVLQGGGGNGGAVVSANQPYYGGGGGGCGSFALKKFTVVPGDIISLAVGGVAGDTSVTFGAVTVTAGAGGHGGNGGWSATGPYGVGGTAGIVTGPADAQLPGVVGANGLVGSPAKGGRGASSIYGFGGNGGTQTPPTAPAAAVGKGAGGGGAGNFPTYGAAGTPGFIALSYPTP